MKPLLAAAAGFTLSLGMFAGGAVLATYTLSAKPVAVKTGPTQDVADLWTAEARAIEPGDQDLERVAAAPLPPEPEMTAEAGAGEEITLASADPSAWPGQDAAIDETTTAAIGAVDEAPAGDMQDAGLPVAHLQWCADRYRSYRPETNSYTPYGGGSRTCVSPHAGPGQAEDTMVVAQAGVEENSSQIGRHVETASRHVQSCFDRYRSYRPEDNSYQPYGGGPRQQCE